MIKDVEELCPKLKRGVFIINPTNPRGFCRREIPIELARSENHTDPAIAVSGAVSHRRGSTKGARIEETGASAGAADTRGEIPRGRDIGVGRSRAHLRTGVLETVNRSATTVRYSKGCSVLNRGQARNIPTVDQTTHDSLSLREREIPAVVHRQTVRVILRIQAVLL